MTSHDTLLVDGAEAIVTGWMHYFSPASFPLFRPERSGDEQHRLLYRDLLILGFLGLSILTFTRWQALSVPWRLAAGGLAIYRILDLALTLVGLGIFGALRHGTTLQELSRRRVQRTLIAIVLNYIELMFWFATLYLWIGARPGAFSGTIAEPHEAFLMSMSTMTTTGYGRHSPIGTSALFLATSQAVLTLVIYAIVVGGLVGSLSEDSHDRDEKPLRGPSRYVVHNLTPLLAYLACIAVAYWGVGM